MLKVTGDEAFTTEGKLRNLGSELLGGNIIGGIKALTATKPVEFDKPLQAALDSLEEAKRLAKDTTLTMDELVQAQTRGAVSSDKPFEGRAGERYKTELEGASDALEELLQKQIEGGHLSTQQAKDLSKVTQEYVKNEKFALAAAAATDAYNRAIERAGGNAAKLFGPEQGGPGAIAAAAAQAAAGNRDTEIMFGSGREGTVIGQQRTGIPRAITQPNTSVFRAEDPGNQIANQIRDSINSRIKNDEERLRLDVRNKTIIQRQAKAAFDSAKELAEANHQVNGAAKQWGDYVIATTGVKNATAAAAAATEAAAAEAQALGDSVRTSIAQRAGSDSATQQALLQAARVEEKNARTFFEGKRGTDQANDAYAAWQAAKTKTFLLEQSIAATAKAAAEAAKQSAENAQQQALQNAITAAEQSGNVPAIKAAYGKAIAYWQAIADGSKATSEAHQDAVAQVLGLTAALKASIGSTTEGVQQARIQNDIALAALKGLDTRPFLAAMVRFAKQAMDSAKVGTLAFEQAKGAWITARQNLASTNDTLNELKRANAKARAALTESQEDDEKLLRADIRRLERKVKATKGMGIIHQQAIAALLADERELKAMVDEIKPTTTVFDLLTESTKAFTEHAGNVINAGNRFTADSFTEGLRNQFGTQPNAAGRARLGLDDGKITTSLDNLTTATNRLVVAYTGTTQPRGHPPAEGATVVGGTGGRWGAAGRWGSWQESFAAARARGGIS